MTVLKSVLPIYTVTFSPLIALVMLVAFDWPGRIILIGSLSLGMFLSARNVFRHHSLKLGGTVSDKTRLEAQERVFTLFREVEN